MELIALALGLALALALTSSMLCSSSSSSAMAAQLQVPVGPPGRDRASAVQAASLRHAFLSETAASLRLETVLSQNGYGSIFLSLPISLYISLYLYLPYLSFFFSSATIALHRRIAAIAAIKGKRKRQIKGKRKRKNKGRERKRTKKEKENKQHANANHKMERIK